MVKPRFWKDSFSDHERFPQFFKIFLPNLCSRRLRIPPDFLTHFNGVLPYNSTITSPPKRSWEVDLKEDNGTLYFHKGWLQFVQDNSLEFGDFLVFYYGGNAKFYVKIYGKNGCPKVTDGRASEQQQEKQTIKKRKAECLARKARSKAIAKKRGKTLKDARKFSFKCPFFKIVMKPSYVDRGLMHVPASFIRDMEKWRRNFTLQVADKSWHVKLTGCPKTSFRFSSGWGIFAKENTLKAGDVCLFELTEKDECVVKVSILRRLD